MARNTGGYHVAETEIAIRGRRLVFHSRISYSYFVFVSRQKLDDVGGGIVSLWFHPSEISKRLIRRGKVSRFREILEAQYIIYHKKS